MSKMDMQVFHKILTGLILIGICNLGYATPATNSVEGSLHEDDYQYSDDESVSSTRSTETSSTNIGVPFFLQNNITIEAIVGKNVVLECPVQNISDHNVVLWFKDENALTNGPLVLNKNFTLNTTNFALNVLNATQANQGEYYCEIIPQKIRFRTKLIMKQASDENAIPENSKSSQLSLHSSVSRILTASSVIGIFLFLRI